MRICRLLSAPCADNPACAQVRTRSITLPTFVSSKESLEAAALKLLSAELPIAIRLMGIRVSHFRLPPAASASQPTLAALVQPRTAAAPGAAVANPSQRGTTAPAERDADKGCIAADVVEPATAQGGDAAAMRDDARACVDICEFAEASNAPARCAHAGDPGVDAQAAVQAEPHDASANAADAACAPAPPLSAASLLAADDELPAPDEACRVPDELQQHTEPVPTARHQDVCARCGAHIPQAQMQEHIDWHVAQELSAMVNGPGYMAPAGKRAQASRTSDCEAATVEDCSENHKRRKSAVTPPAAPQAQAPKGRSIRSFFGA